MTRSVVDFPAPFAPISATILPSSTLSEMPFSAVICPYRATRSRTSRMGGPPWTRASPSGLRPEVTSSAHPSQIGLNHALVALDVGGGAFGDLLAVIQDHDVLGHLHDHFHVVLHENHRH